MNLNDLQTCALVTDGALRDTCALTGALAYEALMREAYLTPKPGLVDARNCGAHRDMNLHTFSASADALAPYFPRFAAAGCHYGALPADEILPLVRPLGLAAEQSMLLATSGVNTHKGGIFALGLLCTAAGRLLARHTPLRVHSLCAEVKAITCNLVERELASAGNAHSAGERLFQRFGLTGARGEAARGYATVREHALPAYLALRQQGARDEIALLQALLHLMARNADTNLVARGGLAGLEYVQQTAQRLLQAGGVSHRLGRARMIELDDDLITRQLSPGGSADLLAVTWFLSRFELAPVRQAYSAAAERHVPILVKVSGSIQKG
ncbi:2-(5''-triphosphoribosyl)-3'-dephosphocoenzyme-A synthase [Caballeronia sp. SBC1]|uniref:triphosphoribosyl-dephospho-CoA synthase CitG n=1 Tax=Caballeronia sp. SBC1 TaxID=2705548 RepID=UPI00140C2D61|nr:triphosphoribosyl-dephospho-CoA synthase CitG [Caballeronia sp. SBC1]QIN63500.1 2-(5''-triphosphoribosyl)-3'-dephosphocoenzyme-A synthase [Caballeronia sp. SBC1]